jgi:phosphoribosyl 1,2-cyclic phosphate phosphodiesterase
MRGKFLFLGTGSSLGVPIIACQCPICRSTFSYNKRLRSSGLLSLGGKNFLIDMGPDFRQQALKFSIDSISGVLLSHLHADHIAGVEDVRIFYSLQHKSIPCLLSIETKKEILHRYYYLFQGEIAAPYFDFQLIPEDFSSLLFEGMKISCVSYYQKEVKVNGYRIGDFAYLTDIRNYEEKIFDSLRGVEVLVMSLVRPNTTSLHLGLEEVIAFSKRVGAKETYFTHLSHEFDPKTLSLPKGFFLAHDGLELSFLYEDR